VDLTFHHPFETVSCYCTTTVTVVVCFSVPEVLVKVIV